ncbi:winged helix-turn-helix domain-containing protein [Luteibacter sp. PPL201]|uniref:Winged helix-turn-helix domain-containing protein n=1 Tax=Luteibacter sahnii TaxID=3021977 RepID=A0ABT6B5M2_9GAMM
MRSERDPIFFSLGDWTVRPAERSIERDGERHVLEPKLIDVLAYLAGSGGAVVSTEQILTDCWRGTFYGDNPVHKTVALLRKILKDDARSPRYIATVRKRGYQVIARVAFADARERAWVPRGSWRGGSPFRGLLAFGSDDRHVFFGRAQASAAVLRVVRRSHAEGCAFVLVTGPSGCGKSSLVQASVVPTLSERAGYDGLRVAASVTFSARQPAHTPLESLASALCRLDVGDRPVFVETERPALVRALADDLPFVTRRIASALRDARGTVLLAIDALEGLTALPAAEVAPMIDALDHLARSGLVLVVATCRNDFYPALMAMPTLRALKQDGGIYDLAPPTPGELAQIIRLPAYAADLRFGRDPQGERLLDDVLLDAACRATGSLPLLQYTLQALYEARDDDGTLGFAAYAALGGIEGALASRAERIHASLDARAAKTFPRLLHRLVTVSGEDEAIACTVRWRDVDDDERHAVRQLVDGRLIVSLLDNDEPCFTVAHEALLRHWPRVVQWLEAHRAALRTRARLGDMSRRWHADGQRREYLIPRGQLLADARHLMREGHPPLDKAQRSFVRRSSRHARMAMVLLCAMAGAILGLAVFSSVAAVDARLASRRAEARRADAEGLLDFMLGDMYERLSALGRLDLLDEVTGRAMAVLMHDGRRDDPDAVARQARALRQIGEIRFARGDLDAAAQALQSAAASVDRLATGDPSLAVAYAERGKIDFWRAQVAAAYGHADEALHWWRTYRSDALQRVRLEPDDPDGWLELSYAENSLGTAALRAGRADEAKLRFDASAALKRRVLGMRPDDHAVWLEQADTMSWLASVEQQHGDLASALDHLGQERDAVRAGRAGGAPTDQWLYRRALSDLHLARAQADMGLATEADATYATAAATFRRLVDDTPDNRQWQRDLALTLSQRGWLAFGMGDSARALRCFADAARLLRDLSRIDARVADWRLLLAVNRTWESSAWLREGRIGDAAAAINEALALYGDVPPDAAATRLLRAGTQIVAGEIARARGDESRALGHWRAAVAELRPRALHGADPRVLDPYVRVSLLLGHDDAASPSLERLRASGYRAPAFESFVHIQSKDH